MTYEPHPDRSRTLEYTILEQKDKGRPRKMYLERKGMSQSPLSIRRRKQIVVEAPHHGNVIDLTE